MKIGAFDVMEPLPEPRESHAISILHPWIDAGNVGTLSLVRLEQHFGAQQIAHLTTPGVFFDFTRYRPVTKMVDGKRTLTVPNTTVSLAKQERGPDVLLCRIYEPHSFAEAYIDSLHQLFKALHVKRHTRLGGMWDAVPHTRPLLVTGTQDGKPLSNAKGLTPRRWGQYEGPTTILGLLNNRLEADGVENISFMVHLPQYLQLEEDFTGTARLLEALSSFYPIPASVTKVEMGTEQYEELNTQVERNPEAKRLVSRLEAHYDTRTAAAQEQEKSREEVPPLSPGIQQFLNDLGRRLEEG